MENKYKRWYALAILNVLLRADDYLTTKQICDKVGCERKSVYSCVDVLEVNGFSVDIKKQCKGRGRGSVNTYKLVGIFGL